MAKKDNFDDYRLQLLAKAREEEEKRLKVNRDLNKELNKQLESEEDIDKEYLDNIIGMIPQKKLGQPKDVGALAAFFASEMSLNKFSFFWLNSF